MILRILGLLATVWLCAPAAGKPNVVLILADDLGGRDLGCYGSTFHQTPHLDSLAKRGMRFTNAYSASPLCSPTRASILTGLCPARTGITAPVCHLPAVILEKRLAPGKPATRVLNAESITRLKTDYLTLPEVLRGAGYCTGHFGKWHLGTEPYSPLQHGFDVDLPHTPGPGPGGGNGYFAPWAFWKDQGKPGDHIDDRMAEEAVQFIRNNKDRPFFLNYWAFSVHSPWMAKEAYMAEAAQRANPDSAQRNPMYAAMIRSLDEAVGRIIAVLDELKLSNNTLVIFTSDNGGWHSPPRETANNRPYAAIPVTSNAPFRSGKASNYEGGTRVPLLIAWPEKIAAGAMSDAIVQSTDLFPTITDLAAVELPAKTKFDGISIAPALRGENLPREAIFCHFPHCDSAGIDGFQPGTWVRRGPWKLIRFHAANQDGSDRLELYNLRDDIGENRNLATAEPKLAGELNGLISRYLAETEAVVPKLNPEYAPPAGKSAAAADPLLGWKARHCEAKVKEGIVTVTATDGPAFFGYGAGKTAGPATVKMRIRASSGSGKIEWLRGEPANSPTPAKSVAYKTIEGWQEIVVDLPAAGPLGILRVYFPADTPGPVELDWIELTAGGKPRRWDF